MKYPKIHVAQTIIALCKAKGIDRIVISPGSRSAPLTIGFTEDPDFHCYSIVDERCAGFFALGLAQQLRHPVALVCTSGSALLNYYPAISEAFYSDIPLVVISADRPKYRIDIGDGQTIRQDNVFDRHILGSYNLRQDTNHATEHILNKDKHKLPPFIDSAALEEMQLSIQRKNEEDINSALQLAMEQSGPVHINVPFEEPLYQTVETPSVVPNTSSPKIVASEIKVEELSEMADLWNSSTKKMVLVGVNYPDAVSERILDVFAKDPSVIVFTETTSNIHHKDFLPNIDKLIAPIEQLEDAERHFERLRPDILLTFGGMVVSKKVKAFLRRHQPNEHWHIGPKKAYDTFYCLSKYVKAFEQDFLDQFVHYTEMKESDYQSYLKSLMEKRRDRHDQYLKQIPYCDLKAFDHILSSIPNGYQLQLGNSSTVRYVQLFDVNPTVKQFCNRGTSGIDGSTSTAIGASLISNSPTLFITGDLSFFYDSNALWNTYIRNDFRIIVINNGGGGIFRILPGNTDSQNFDNYFETTHHMTAKHLASMYHIDYHSAKTDTELSEALKDFYTASEQPKILEVFTPRKENSEFLLSYFDFLKQG